MRLIGHLPSETNARTFGDYLFVQGIENRVEFEKDSGWAVWVNDEDQLSNASQLLDRFNENPTDPKYRNEAKSAAEKRAELEKGQEAYRKRMLKSEKVFRPVTAYTFGPASLVLILICVGVYLLSRFGRDFTPVSALFITTAGGLQEIMHGQVWRLVTPIFIHFNIFHILFNMLWLKDLGTMVETIQSSKFLVLLVLILGMGSNLAQFFVSGPIFGGMSGVVYGLFGYIWIRGKFDPGSGYALHPTTVAIILIWFVVCYFGLVGSVANTAHLSGLAIGALWGFAAARR